MHLSYQAICGSIIGVSLFVIGLFRWYIGSRPQANASLDGPQGPTSQTNPPAATTTEPSSGPKTQATSARVTLPRLSLR